MNENTFSNALKAFAGSRKALVLSVAIIGVVALNIAGKIEVQAALDFIWKIVGIWMGAVAVEDAAAKTSARKEDPGDVQ